MASRSRPARSFAPTDAQPAAAAAVNRQAGPNWPVEAPVVSESTASPPADGLFIATGLTTPLNWSPEGQGGGSTPDLTACLVSLSGRHFPQPSGAIKLVFMSQKQPRPETLQPCMLHASKAQASCNGSACRRAGWSPVPSAPA